MFKSIFKQLELPFIIIFSAAIVMFILDLVLGIKSHWGSGNIIFLVAIFVINSFLAIYSYQKNIILPYLLLSATIIVEALLIIVNY
jgi:hypothetical protein